MLTLKKKTYFGSTLTPAFMDTNKYFITNKVKIFCLSDKFTLVTLKTVL